MLSAGWRNGYLRGTDHNQCRQIYVKKMLDINRKSPKYIYKKTEQLKDNFIPNLGFSIPSLGIEKPKFGTDIPRGGIESGKGEGSEGRKGVLFKSSINLLLIFLYLSTLPNNRIWYFLFVLVFLPFAVSLSCI